MNQAKTVLLFYSARTEGYKGEPVPSIDKIVEMSVDFERGVVKMK